MISKKQRKKPTTNEYWTLKEREKRVSDKDFWKGSSWYQESYILNWFPAVSSVSAGHSSFIYHDCKAGSYYKIRYKRIKNVPNR